MGGTSVEAVQQTVPLVESNMSALEYPPRPDPERVRENVMLLLQEFAAELASVQSETEQQLIPFGESEWLCHLELKFLLRAHRMELLRAVSRCVVGEVKNASQNYVAKEALSVVDELLGKIETHAQARLTATNSNLRPLVLRLASRYGLNAGEADLFQLLFMRGASKSAAVRTLIGARAEAKEMALILCGMSPLEVGDFLNEKRTHMAEGMIVGLDDDDAKTIRMTNDAVSVLLLRPLRTEQRLKFSKTELLSVMEESMAESSADVAVEIDAPALSNVVGEDKLLANSAERGLMKLLGGEGEAFQGEKPKFEDVDDVTIDDAAAQVGQLDEREKAVMELQRKRATLSGDVGSSEADVTNGIEPVMNGAATGTVSSKEDLKEGELSAYTSSLEYLDDAFQVLALKLRIARARHKEDMKEASNDDRRWYDVHRSAKASSIRELRATLRFVQNRLQERMELTEDACKHGSAHLPRLEALARKLCLDEFEKGVVVILAGVAISPVIKSICEADPAFRRYHEAIQVKDILNVTFDSFKEQVLARTYFYKSSRLVARGLIKLHAGPFSRGRGADLMNQEVELDRRMLDWIVGLDTEMNELVEGSHLYKPKIPMQQVVLPEEQKDMLLRTVENFAMFKQYRKRAGLEDVMSYGAGLVILLCGPSGTGKTMTVNALAHHLGKRVLLVDFNSLHAASKGSNWDDHAADLRGLFRDADMNDAIIFFDECEAIFTQRERGGDKMLNSLLTAMERHEGIIMLATNRPLDLDEAMYRRITCVSEFHPPDHTQRRSIWKISSERLPVIEEIDWDKIALRYELTGGYIKNALVGALLTAISRDSLNPTMTEEDIVNGCSLQMRGSLHMKTFSHRVVPKTGMDELILSSGMREKMNAIISFEKARAVLLGQWGFQQERLGTACLFWGPHGTGKSSAAEAIGFELGRPLKVINSSQLISQKNRSQTGINITTAFRDSRLMDAVLVLEDFQSFRSGDDRAGRVESVSPWSDMAIGILLHELGRFPGICILISNNVQGSVIHRLEPELTTRLKFLIEFKMPDSSVRARMWQKMIPSKCPLASGIKFEELGRRFDFTSGTISSAIVRAAAKASLRTGDACVLMYKDLVEAAEAERAHSRDELTEVLLAAYT